MHKPHDFHTRPSGRTPKRRSGKAIVLFLLIMGAVVAGVFLLPRKYESDAKLFVRLGRESATLDATAQSGQNIPISQPRQNEINSVVELLESRVVLEGVVERLTPETLLGSSRPGNDDLARDEAVLRVQWSTRIYAARNTHVVTVHCEAKSPELAQRMVRAYVDSFHELHARVNQTSGSKDFFAAQDAALHKKLDEASDSVRAAKNAAGLATVEGRRQFLQQQLSEAETEERKAKAQLAAAQSKIDALKKVLRKSGDASEELLGAASSMHPTHQKLIQDLVTEMAQADGLRTQIDVLTRQREDLVASLRLLNAQEIRIADLERRRDLLDGSYRTNHHSLEQARIEQELSAQRVSNINVAQGATFVVKPVSPNRPLCLGVGFVLALAAAVGLAFRDERKRQSRQSAKAAQQHVDWSALLAMPKSEGAGREEALVSAVRSPV